MVTGYDCSVIYKGKQSRCMNIKISNANNIKLYIRRVCIQNSYKYKKKILDKYVFVISTSIILA